MTLITSVLQRQEHRTLALMLALLHVVIWWDFGGGVSRSLMLAHLGLFLLWQVLRRRCSKWSRHCRYIRRPQS